MKRRRQYTAAAVSFTLAAFAVLGGFIYINHQKAETYKRQIVYGYQHAFSELVTSLTEMDTALQKCVHAGTPPMMTEVCTEVYGKSMSAKMALGELPFSDVDFENASGFVSKTGDYAYMISKKTARGEPCGEEELTNLRALSDTTSVLSNNYLQLLAQLGEGSLTLEELLDLHREAAEAGKKATSRVFGERVKVSEEEFPELPTLIYDGPFSSHIADMKPRLTQGEGEITSDEASALAAAFMDVKQDEVKFDGERGGNLPVYTYSMERDGDAVTIEVSKQGGHIVNVYSSHIARDRKASDEEAVKTALEYLAQKGYHSMRESYRMAQGNMLTVNFAHEENGVICYPDLVKIVVALDTGKAVGFEGQSYVMNHRAREIPAPKITEEQAREKVSKNLTVLSHELAVIPTGGKNEVFCHEFKCETADGQHYITYINAETGAEAKILILLEDENGTLAI
ncbi:MAG: germination protein YpeB [Oscillospiraceae bacterium]|jgi:germination protein YpeB|nr:germination protein YpeB [Oscillospiraceae bacterium]